MRANWKEVEVEKEMCEALRELFAEELKESREDGISQNIRTMMKNLKMTAQQAMDVLEIPVEERSMYLEKLEL